MPGAIRYEVTGFERLRYIISRAKREAVIVVASALYEEATVIFNETQRVTPVRFGVLRGTGFVEPPVVHNTSVEVTMGYGGPAAPYAFWVHERVFGQHGRRIRHDSPTKAKFLEEPVLAAQAHVGDRIARRMASRLFAGGGS